MKLNTYQCVQNVLYSKCISIVLNQTLQLFEYENPVFFTQYIGKFYSSFLMQHLQRSVFFDFYFFSPALSIPSSLEQGCFLFLLSPKPFSFGWSVKDSDNQRGEARRPAGEGAQEAGQIYWAASGRRTIRQGRAMPHRAGRSGKDFSLYLILMSMFVCRYVACTVWDKTVWRL